MGEKIRIPLSVLRKNFILKLNTLINESGLEPYMIESILKDAYERMAVETERQYQRELAAYNKSLQDNEDKGE